MPVDRGLSFLAHSSPGNGLFVWKKRMVIPASSSLGCARKDETGEGISHISFQPIAEANLCPFGAPPSRGRRENAAGIGLPFLAHRLRGRPFAGEGGRMPSFRIVISSESEKSFSSPFPMTPSLSLLGDAPPPLFRDTVFPVSCCQTLSVLPPTKKIPRLRLG